MLAMGKNGLIIRLKVTLDRDADSTSLISYHRLEMFTTFVNNQHCKQLMFGCCHDNGYLPNLDPYIKNPAMVARITLMRRSRLGQAYSNLPFAVADFSSVFRTTDLPDTAAGPANDGLARHVANTMLGNGNLQSQNNRFNVRSNEGVETHAEFMRPSGNHQINLLTYPKFIYPGPVYLNAEGERLDG